MSALALIDALETPLKPTPRFTIEPTNGSPGDEVDAQDAFRGMLRYVGPSVMSWGVPNAGKRGFKAQRRAKREGLTAGVADEHYAWNHGIAFLEWKNGKDKPEDHQVDWLNAMVDRGFHVAVVRTPEFALQLLEQWGAPVRARVAA